MKWSIVIDYHINDDNKVKWSYDENRKPIPPNDNDNNNKNNKMLTNWWGMQNAAPLKFDPKPS